jgi:release factor glutamine methyltransferase
MEALTWTAGALKARGMESARLEAELLLSHVTGLSRVELYTHHDRPLSMEERASYRDLVRRRMDGEPSQYLTGTQEFWSLSFQVAPGVLIPRGDTEVLVEEALAYLRDLDREDPLIVDVGTGSGAIALALAAELPNARVVACDVCPKALEIARANSALHGSSVKFVQGDLRQVLEKLSTPPDVIVSNPPYIPSERIEGLMVEVREHEPRVALDGGADGLDVIRPLILLATQALGSGGGLFVEIADRAQADQVLALLEEADGWTGGRVRDDYGSLARVVCAARAA